MHFLQQQYYNLLSYPSEWAANSVCHQCKCDLELSKAYKVELEQRKKKNTSDKTIPYLALPPDTQAQNNRAIEKINIKIYLYVFLTDPNRRIKTLRAVNVEQDEKNKEGEENKGLD